jgi:hypothetical protein
MSTSNQLSDAELFERYLGQAPKLPDHLRRAVEAAWSGEPVLAYALSDLDRELHFHDTWFVLGDRHAAVASGDENAARVESFERARIQSVSHEPGLSCRVFRVHGESDREPLAELFFTQRQKRNFEAIAFVLEQALEGRSVPLDDADTLYVSSVLDPVREAQALVVPNKLAVVWRLLSYFRPYKTRLVLGTSAALGITLFSMLPPLITGYLVDRVIGPVQSGQISASTVSTVAWLAVGGIAT